MLKPSGPCLKGPGNRCYCMVFRLPPTQNIAQIIGFVKEKIYQKFIEKHRTHRRIGRKSFYRKRKEAWRVGMEYAGIEGTLKYIAETVTELKREMLDLQTKSDLRLYTLKEIAQGFGYSTQTLRNSPWKIPNYGKPDEGCNPGKWYYKTIASWCAIPEDERRFKWEQMSSRERRKAMGSIPKTKTAV